VGRRSEKDEGRRWRRWRRQRRITVESEEVDKEKHKK
jgi:hypothetical protein